MTDDIPPEITEVHELIQACGRLLAGHSPHVIGAVVADLTATWAARHLDLASKENTDRLRAELLEMHHDAIKRLIPINERLILGEMKKGAH